jgi:hypothetical protein
MGQASPNHTFPVPADGLAARSDHGVKPRTRETSSGAFSCANYGPSPLTVAVRALLEVARIEENLLSYACRPFLPSRTQDNSSRPPRRLPIHSTSAQKADPNHAAGLARSGKPPTGP